MRNANDNANASEHWRAAVLCRRVVGTPATSAQPIERMRDVGPLRMTSPSRRQRTAALQGAILVIASLLFASPALAQPAADRRKTNFERPGYRLVDGVWTKTVATLNWADLARVTQDGRLIRVLAAPSPRAEKLVAGSRQALVELSDSPFAFRIDTLGRVWLPGRKEAAQALRVQLAGKETPIDTQMRMQSLVITQGTVEVVGRRAVFPDPVNAPNKHLERVAYLTFAPTGQVTVIVQDHDPANNNVAVNVRIRTEADNLYDLARAYGDSLRTDVRPLLAEMSMGEVSLGVGSADAYRAFPTIEPTPLQAKQLADLLPDLASDDAAVSARAEAQLAELGSGAVLAASRVDRSDLSGDARDRIDRFLRSRSVYADVGVEALLGDRDFLLDCLAFPDPRIAAAARARIKEQFEVDVPAASTPDEIEKLRSAMPRSILFK
jgi:hypothetical protein